MRYAWRGQWGAFTDGRSKLSRLAQRIERELHDAYVIETALDRRRVRMAARYYALAEKTIQTMDVDPKAARRAATALQKVANSQLTGLRASAAPADSAESFADLVRRNGLGRAAIERQQVANGDEPA
jgi:hypothetical protein